MRSCRACAASLRQAAQRNRQAGPAQARRRAGRTRPQRARAHDRAAGAHAAQRGRARPGNAGTSARKAGKPEEGTVRIAVRREGSEVVLEVGDDGAGLDREAIRKRADRARPDPQPMRVLADGDLDALIFEPGFSTADAGQPPRRPRRRHGRGRQRGRASSAARSTSTRAQARAPPSPCACRRRWRSPRRCSCASARPASRCRSPRCSGVGRIARDRSRTRPTAATAYGGEEYALHDLGALLGHAAGQAPKASCRCRCCWSAPATCARRCASTRSSATAKSWSSRSARRSLGAGHLRRDDHGRRPRRRDPRRRAAGASPRPTLPRDVAAGRAGASRRASVPLVMVVDDSVTMRKVTGRVLERHNFEVGDREGRHRRAGAHGRARAGPDAARHRNAAHGRLRAGHADEGRSAPARRADHHDHLAYRRKASPARLRDRRAALPRQAVPGARTAAQRVRAAGAGTGRSRSRHECR